MFTSFPLLVLIPIFVVAAAVTWLAGTQLSNTTDVISSRFGLGEALGGIISRWLSTYDGTLKCSCFLLNDIKIQFFSLQRSANQRTLQAGACHIPSEAP